MPGDGTFTFAEGDERYTVFVPAGETWLMRTLAYGERSSEVLQARVLEMRAAH